MALRAFVLVACLCSSAGALEMSLRAGRHHAFARLHPEEAPPLSSRRAPHPAQSQHVVREFGSGLRHWGAAQVSNVESGSPSLLQINEVVLEESSLGDFGGSLVVIGHRDGSGGDAMHFALALNGCTCAAVALMAALALRLGGFVTKDDMAAKRRRTHSLLSCSDRGS